MLVDYGADLRSVLERYSSSSRCRTLFIEEYDQLKSSASSPPSPNLVCATQKHDVISIYVRVRSVADFPGFTRDLGRLRRSIFFSNRSDERTVTIFINSV